MPDPTFSHEFFIDGAQAIFSVKSWAMAGALFDEPDPLSVVDAQAALETYLDHPVEITPGSTPGEPDDRHAVLSRGDFADTDLLTRSGNAFIALPRAALGINFEGAWNGARAYKADSLTIDDGFGFISLVDIGAVDLGTDSATVSGTAPPSPVTTPLGRIENGDVVAGTLAAGDSVYRTTKRVQTWEFTTPAGTPHVSFGAIAAGFRWDLRKVGAGSFEIAGGGPGAMANYALDASSRYYLRVYNATADAYGDYAMTVTGDLIAIATPHPADDPTRWAALGSASAAANVKQSVKAASVTNVSLAAAGSRTIDGYSCAAGDRVLLMAQTAGAENGIYVVGSDFALTRAPDANVAAELVGAIVLVERGSTNADKEFQQTVDTITLGTTALVWTLAPDVTGKMDKSANLSDVADTGTARANLRVPALLPAQAVATSNVASRSGFATIDGVTLTDGDQVLLVAQSTPSQNGPWVAHSGAWTRPTDFPAGAVVKSRTIRVVGGTLGAGKDYTLAVGPGATVTVDTTSQSWSAPSAESIDLQGGESGWSADFSTGAPGTPATIFDIGSLTQFDRLQAQTGGSLTYDTGTVLAPMTRSMKIAASIAAQAYMSWDTPRLGRIDWPTFGRCYINPSASPGQILRLLQWYEDVDSRGFVQLTTARKIGICDQSGATVALSTTVLTAGQWYRLEWDVTRHVSAGVVTLRIYAGHGSAPVETLVSTAFNTGTYIDRIDFGSVNNSNLGAMTLSLGAFVDGATSQPGVYGGEPESVRRYLNAEDDTSVEISPEGEFIVRALKDTILDGSQYKVRKGDVIFRVTKAGSIVGGPSLLGPAGIYRFLASILTGRVQAYSFTAIAQNDPGDLTLMRVNSNNDDRTGTDGATTGPTFTAATAAFTSIDVNKAIIVGGTRYFITAILSATSATLETVAGNPASFSVASGVTWSIGTAPFSGNLSGVNTNGPVGQVRWEPYAYPFVRAGTDAVVNGTDMLTSAAAAFTAADTGRAILLNNDATRIYKLVYVNATTVTLHDTVNGTSKPDPNTASGVTWAISGNDRDLADRLAANPATIGVKPIDEVRQFAADGSKCYSPVDMTFSLMGRSLYPGGSSGDQVAEWFGAEGRLKLLLGSLDASVCGVAQKVKNGTPTDADWPLGAPPSGTQVIDSSSSPPKTWTKVGGVWVRSSTNARAQTRLTARGLIAENSPVEGFQAGNPITSKQVYAGLVGLVKGDVITQIVVCIQTAAAGTAPTLVKLGLMDAAGVVLAATANVGSDVKWNSTGLQGFNLTTPFTITADGGYYPCFLQDLTSPWGTTALQLARFSNFLAMMGKQFGSGARAVTKSSTATLTDLTGTVTLADGGSGDAFYFAVA